MRPSTKKGFTIVELVAAMVVLTFAALILAVCMNTAWKLRAQAVSWQKDSALLGGNATQKLGRPAALTLEGGGRSFTAPESVGSYARVNDLLTAWLHYPHTLDWSDLNESGVSPQGLPPPEAGDPLTLPAPEAPALQKLSFASSASTDGGAYDYGAALGVSELLVDQHVSVTLRQEFLYLAGGGSGQGDITSVYKKGGAPGSLTAAPKSGNDQPLLVYVAAPLTVSCILQGEGPAHAWVWEPGWYAVPAGTDLFSNALDAETARAWRLDYMSIARPGGAQPSGNDALTRQERAELAERLDKAYARLVLAGVTLP